MIFAFIIFLFILSFLIFIHEFGHFILAKKLGVRVEEFGIGYPPAIWKKKIGETFYSINLVPVGGFVKLYGEEDRRLIKEKSSFISKRPLERAVIISGGVAMNFLVAVLIFYFLLATSGFFAHVPLLFGYKFPFGEQRNLPMIIGIAKDSPAQEVGLRSNDLIIKGNGIEFEGSQSFINFIDNNRGKEVILLIKNISDNQLREVKVVPRLNPPPNEGALGVAIADIIQISYQKPWEKLTAGFIHSLNLSHYSLIGLAHYIKLSFFKKEIEPLASSVVGPVGILALTKITLQEGIYQLVLLVGLISLALCIVNILPIPPLDGGRLLFVFSEMVIGRRIKPSIEQRAQQIGIVFFILLFILITSKDIFQFKDILFKGLIR